MRFIQYARKSSESDERQVQSIQDQEAVLARLAEANGYQIVEKLSEAKSAKMPGTRPIFDEMLEKIRRGEADGILCWHINRLSRNPVDSGQLSWMLQQGTIQCIKTAESQYLPGDNVVVLAVESAVANQYIIDLRKAVARGHGEKAGRHWYPYRPKPGYRLNPETKLLEVDPKRFDLLCRAWRILVGRSANIPTVHGYLEDWGYRTRRKSGLPGKAAKLSYLYTLFSDPFYCGEYEYEGQWRRSKHPPMVTRAEFDRVQEFIHGPIKRKMSKQRFAFTGLMLCGHCGCQITAERKVKHYPQTKRTAVYDYYRCTRKHG